MLRGTRVQGPEQPSGCGVTLVQRYALGLSAPPKHADFMNGRDQAELERLVAEPNFGR